MKPETKRDKKAFIKIQPLLKLKPYFEQVLILIYKFRVLNREQIQILVHHKHHEKIRIWLNYLSDNKYLKKEYRKKLDEEPSSFSLGVGGRKYFLDHPEIKDINHKLLDRVWREYRYSKTFKKHCLFLGHIYLSLLVFVKKAGLSEKDLHFYTSTDLIGVRYLISKQPDAYFFIDQKDGKKKRYFIDIIDWYRRLDDVEKRVWQYIRYFEKDTWQNNFKCSFPETILVFPNTTLKNKLNQFIKNKLEERRLDMLFYLSTWDEIQHQGINSQVLHKVEVK